MLVYGGVGGAVLLVLIVAIFLMSGNKGGDEPDAEAGAETTAIPQGTGPTKSELDEGQRLYREARKLVESAESLPSKTEADKLRLQARELLDRATGIWDAAMARISEEKREGYVKYEEDYVRQWQLLKRRTQIVN